MGLLEQNMSRFSLLLCAKAWSETSVRKLHDQVTVNLS